MGDSRSRICLLGLEDGDAIGELLQLCQGSLKQHGLINVRRRCAGGGFVD